MIIVPTRLYNLSFDDRRSAIGCIPFRLFFLVKMVENLDSRFNILSEAAAKDASGFAYTKTLE
jgi:hypothetical protein